eukprot:TRINITY_DN4022_c0_g1_i1.p1 TRINITY_DN4022_c0_g1~~TRINITY_DN4022_c0_g1_i1.p1  ORF type:complete len:238 (-),score=22.07 TRINITY_DN4022_c0_g1_i1:624-1337(-)
MKKQTDQDPVVQPPVQYEHAQPTINTQEESTYNQTPQQVAVGIEYDTQYGQPNYSQPTIDPSRRGCSRRCLCISVFIIAIVVICAVVIPVVILVTSDDDDNDGQKFSSTTTQGSGGTGTTQTAEEVANAAGYDGKITSGSGASGYYYGFYTDVSYSIKNTGEKDAYFTVEVWIGSSKYTSKQHYLKAGRTTSSKFIDVYECCVRRGYYDLKLKVHSSGDKTDAGVVVDTYEVFSPLY